jgi:hypothetical protein
MASGDTAYHVRQLFRSYGASFSADGDTLWMIGATRAGVPGLPYFVAESELVMLDAASGSELGRLEFPHHQVQAMRHDRDAGRLFVAAMPVDAPFDAPIDLLVVDAHTLRIIGRVEAPRDLTCESWCSSAVVAVGPQGVFVVYPRGIYEFDYQP